jgi:uncharacterized membrane protein (UPF0127 family)
MMQDVVTLKFTTRSGFVKGAVSAEIADTITKRTRGLSKRAALPANHGMFFDKVGAYWMKDVNFPLDIVFLDKQGTVLEKQYMPIDIFGYKAASLSTRLYRPASEKAAHAVELPAGWYDAHRIKPGDIVRAVKPE